MRERGGRYGAREDTLQQRTSVSKAPRRKALDLGWGMPRILKLGGRLETLHQSYPEEQCCASPVRSRLKAHLVQLGWVLGVWTWLYCLVF